MRRAKSEQIKSAITQYMKRRHYLDSEIHGRRNLTTDLGDMSVKKRLRMSTGVENSVACSSIFGDFNSCDQQFARLRKFVLESSPERNEELSALLFPVFVHMYSDLLAAGHKASAHKFHERHTEIVHVEEQKDFVRSLRKLESKADLQAAKDVAEFREHKYTVRLSHSTITHLLTHLKAADNMIILQIINQHINLVGTNTQGKTLELRPSPSSSSSSSSGQPSSAKDAARHKDREEKDVIKKEMKRDIKAEPSTQHEKLVSPVLNGMELSPAEMEAARKLQEVGGRLEALPPPLPSILFYTVINSSAHQGLCTSTISPDCQLLSGGFEDSSIRLYRLQPISLPVEPTATNNSSIPLAADYIFKEESERRVEIDTGWDEGVRLRAHNGPVYKTQFTPDSSHLLSCSRDSSVRLWDIARRTNTALYRGHSGSIWDLDYCPTTNHFATSSRDLTVKLWALDRVYPLRTFVGHQQDIQAVAIHPNGNYIASGSADKTVRLWDIQDGKCLRTMCGHRGSILSLAFSPNGLMLASAGDDRRIQVWDLKSGWSLKELRGHTDTVYSLAFSPCSQMLASGGHDCLLRLWDVRCGAEDRGGGGCGGGGGGGVAAPAAAVSSSASSQMEGHTSSELIGAFPTKSATVTSLSFPTWHLLHAVGANQ
ncbi:TAF5-like RNA polymerase II p300/CBP-associated factor-associated factor 65 kDa subunit 5L [Babylonia areolata]|uniref:TAF5-like RNA polymerase II p300/CBP-associated factor-associated factor 65 kDa subunit 5L n=1 Tax=Babylonia areolata TaxID=304850 RepID=UPI003FD0602A